VPISHAQSDKGSEKGVDIAMAIDALQVGLENKIDVAILVTGDGDFVPLIRALMKNGIRVGVAHFDYESPKRKSFISERLLSASNYNFNITDLEKDRKKENLFRSLFKPVEKRKASLDDKDSDEEKNLF